MATSFHADFRVSLRSLRDRVRRAGFFDHPGGLPLVSHGQGDQENLRPGSSHQRGIGRANQLRRGDAPPELLRRRSVPPELTRIARLEKALAGRAPRTVHDPNRRLAAVAVVFGPDPDSVLLIRRAEREGDRWSGQMAFPGGRWSPDDRDLQVTAQRETREEVGVDLSSARLLGQLDDSAPRSSNLPPVIVRPFVFVLAERVPLAANHEVASARWVSLDQLMAEAVYRPFDFEAAGVRMRFPGYHLAEGVVWGMTERILTPVLEILGFAPPRDFIIP